MDALHEHPRNANLMPEERRAKLRANIERHGGAYPPLVVRPHPQEADAYEVLDGHQRLAALRSLGHDQALCFVWPCDDQTALVLLATLDRLEGEDAPHKRAALLQELTQLIPAADLAALLPEDEALIADTIALLDIDVEALAADLAAAETAARQGDELLTFVVPPTDAEAIREAVKRVARQFTGNNRRGRALAQICRTFAQADGADRG